MKKEERGTALTQQNWERFCVQQEPPKSISVPVPGSWVWATRTPLGRELTGMLGPALGTCRKQNQHQAPQEWPERVQLHLWIDTGLGRGGGRGDVLPAIAN